jgi:hypothetical protein
MFSRSRSQYATAKLLESRSQYATTKPSEGRSRYATKGRSQHATSTLLISKTQFVMPLTSLHQPITLLRTRHEQTPTTIAEPRTSMKQQFYIEFLELFNLADNVTYADLTKKQQLLYPAQFTKWKAVNS